jgi:hypothetical protein
MSSEGQGWMGFWIGGLVFRDNFIMHRGRILSKRGGLDLDTLSSYVYRGYAKPLCSWEVGAVLKAYGAQRILLRCQTRNAQTTLK